MGSAVRTANPVIASARTASAITPSDTTLITCAGIYVGISGNIVITFQNGNSPITFTAVPQGSILPVAISNGFVNAATTASGLIALDW